MTWIKHPVFLESELVRLEPLAHHHFAGLQEIGRHREIWDHLPIAGWDGSALLGSLRDALLKRISGEQYPFAVIDNSTGRVVGATRLFEIFESHKKLEIGWTWYSPGVWGKGHNLHCKLLLLDYCFSQLGAGRVQLKTRTTNLRSMAAIRKLGAMQEGILRKDRIMHDGSVRDTVVFSIIDEEWPAARERLRGKISDLAAREVNM